MAFDVEGARKAGYSDAEIAGFLAAENKFDATAAKKAGYSDTELIAHLSSKTDLAKQIPVEKGANTAPTVAPDPSLIDKAIGTGEAALSTVTGMTGGALGMVAGTVGGLAGAVMDGSFGTAEGAKQVEQSAAKGAEALTYAPRTESGQEQAQAVGQVMQQAIPLMPLTGQMAAAGAAGRSAAPAVSASVGSAKEAALQLVRQRVQEAAARRAAGQAQAPTPGTMGSVGAAGTDIATIRRQSAESLPVPVQLTKGQAERYNFEQQRFEGEIAKDPVKGQRLRDYTEEQNAKALRNFDVFVDEIGATKTDPVAIGDTVTRALRDRASADKTRIRVAYKEAEKAGAMEAPVSLEKVVSYLNESAPDAATAPLLATARNWATKLGLAEEVDGQLVPANARAGSTLMNTRTGGGAVTLKTAETFRQAINRNTDFEPTNIRQATILKGLIDEATEGVGGEKYRAARLLRRQYAERYENFGLARDLLNNKRGMSDAIVPAEKVFQKAILSAPMADVKQIGRLLKSGGEDGRKAWAELQGAAIRHLHEEATKNVSADGRGNKIMSASGLDKAVKQLDTAGKLDYMFGRKGAEQIRALNDLAGLIKTTPPGAINSSNTASVILAALGGVDMVFSGMGGMPLPVMSGLRILTTHVKDRQIQKRINEALGIKPEPKKVKAPQSVIPKTAPAARLPESRTVH